MLDTKLTHIIHFLLQFECNISHNLQLNFVVTTISKQCHY